MRIIIKKDNDSDDKDNIICEVNGNGDSDSIEGNGNVDDCGNNDINNTCNEAISNINNSSTTTRNNSSNTYTIKKKEKTANKTKSFEIIYQQVVTINTYIIFITTINKGLL